MEGKELSKATQKIDLESHNIIFRMYEIQSKIVGHVKNQENLNFLGKDNQSSEANAAVTQMLELFDKNFQVAIIKKLQPAILNSAETDGGKKSLSQEIDDIKRSQMDICNRKIR